MIHKLFLKHQWKGKGEEEKTAQLRYTYILYPPYQLCIANMLPLSRKQFYA